MEIKSFYRDAADLFSGWPQGTYALESHVTDIIGARLSEPRQLCMEEHVGTRRKPVACGQKAIGMANTQLLMI